MTDSQAVDVAIAQVEADIHATETRLGQLRAALAGLRGAWEGAAPVPTTGHARPAFPRVRPAPRPGGVSVTQARRPQGGKVLDPVWRHARAVKAATACRATHARRRLEIGEQFPSKGHAFAAGYRLGYQKACAWWRRKYTREQNGRAG